MHLMRIVRVLLIRFVLFYIECCKVYIYTFCWFSSNLLLKSERISEEIAGFFMFCCYCCFVFNVWHATLHLNSSSDFKIRQISIRTHSPEVFESYLLGLLTVLLQRLVWMTYQIRFHKRYFVSNEIINSSQMKARKKRDETMKIEVKNGF